MASSEEDGTNGGASEAGEEKEATGRRRRLSFLATAWLTFYNIAMTAGYVCPEGPSPPTGPPRSAAPDLPGAGCGVRTGKARLRQRAARAHRVRADPAAGWRRRRGGGRGAGVAGDGRGGGARAPAPPPPGLNGAGRAGEPGAACWALPNTVHGAAQRPGRGPEVKYRPGQEFGTDPRGRRPGPVARFATAFGCR